jgi:hypothetical protein
MASCSIKMVYEAYGAEFLFHLKKKDLMNLFKSLCGQIQEEKFNTLWKFLDDLTIKHAQA